MAERVWGLNEMLLVTDDNICVLLRGGKGCL